MCLSLPPEQRTEATRRLTSAHEARGDGHGRGVGGACAGPERAGGGNREAWKALLRHLEDWLLCGLEESPYHGRSVNAEHPGLGLMEGIVEGDQRAYVVAQAEALAYLQWIKKFANAFLEGGTPRETGNAG